jgi:murein DD-endopeptidase MepM/ murein hydrolase activator NlpD
MNLKTKTAAASPALKSMVATAAAQVTKLADAASAARMIDWLGRHLPVRQRYLLTRNNRLRLRYTLPATSCAVAALLTLVSFSASSNALRGEEFSFIRAAGAIEPAAGDDGALMAKLQASHRRLQRYMHPGADGADTAQAEDGNDRHVTMASFTPRALPQPKDIELEIGKGDTLAAVLNRAGVGASEAYKAVEALKKEFDPRSIRPGQSLYVRLDPVSPHDSEEYRMTRMGIAVDPFKSVALTRDGEDFRAGIEEKTVERHIYARTAPIEVSLYGSAAKADIPNAVTAEVIRILSWDIDFQRDIRRGDVLDVMYDQMETADGKGVRFGNVIFAHLNINGRDVPIYRFEMKDGTVDYFTPDGQSVRKALLSTPVDGARISSGFGQRKHPVLGYTKMHKGIDFAVGVGTPIYAAGDGTIEMMQRWSSFGNYVRIRHNSSIKTAYAHMSKFAKGLGAGSRVKQGQVIGYVGATGRVTGPHLHYEVLMNGTQVNPRSVKLPQGEILKGSELASFKQQVQQVQRQFAELSGRERMKVASAEGIFGTLR